jgi:hypothetical protein
MILWRAAHDESLPADCASFAEERAAAEAYQNNPGYGGPRLFWCEVAVDADRVLDLVEADDAIGALEEASGVGLSRAIGADELVHLVAGNLQDAGYQWVRVRESYPRDSITWVWVGSGLDEPELVEWE